jgi:hypothetical protein
MKLHGQVILDLNALTTADIMEIMLEICYFSQKDKASGNVRK